MRCSRELLQAGTPVLLLSAPCPTSGHRTHEERGVSVSMCVCVCARVRMCTGVHAGGACTSNLTRINSRVATYAAGGLTARVRGRHGRQNTHNSPPRPTHQVSARSAHGGRRHTGLQADAELRPFKKTENGRARGSLASSAHEWLLQHLGTVVAQRVIAAVALGRCVLRPWHLESASARAAAGVIQIYSRNLEIYGPLTIRNDSRLCDQRA